MGGRGGGALSLLGLAGAALAAAGDVLLLGRGCSGADFDQATGMVPPGLEVDARWRSLWNGAAFSERRARLGTVTGLVGIVSVGVGLAGAAGAGTGRFPIPVSLRRVTTVSAGIFTVCGAVTHWSCAAAVSQARSAWSGEGRGPTSGSGAVRLFAAGAAGTLAALAVLSGAQAAAARERGAGVLALATPFPFVLVALLTFGRLPAPLGGFLRPASISSGLLAHFAVTALPPGAAPEGEA